MAGYITVDALETEPLYLGKEDAGHHRWSLNFEMEHRA
jgi:hypothetical protein